MTQVKTGFSEQSARLHGQTADEIPEALRPVVVALAIRYDALLNAVIAASDRD